MIVRLGFIVVVAVSVLTGADARADKRIALIVGNSAYQNVAQLPNPVNDAAAIAALFKKSGFEVVTFRSNLGNLDFKRSLREFTLAARDADIAIVYFAGHGIEVKGTNYLIPVDAKLASDYDVEDEAVSLNRIIDAIEPAKQLHVIILDACRDNPFNKTMHRTIAMRAVTKGLAEVEPSSSNFLIAYAAKAGATAEDGSGSHSPFTAALLNHLATPGLEVGKAFRRVRDEVLKNTNSRQEPFVYSSLGGDDFSLAQPPAAPATPSNAEIRHDYELATQVGTKDAWKSFLAIYPSGFYADLARAQLEKLIPLADQIDRERMAREHIAHEEAVREQTQREEAAKSEQAREHLSREQAERERAAKEQVDNSEREKAKTGGQITMLTPSADLPSEQTKPALFGGALVLEIKKGLTQAGCYAGPIDKEWKTAQTKSAIKKFVSAIHASIISDEPTVDFLDVVRSHSEHVCPLECGVREVEKNGQCIAKTCQSGFTLDDDGDCAKEKAGIKRAASPPQTSVSTNKEIGERGPCVMHRRQPERSGPDAVRGCR